MKSPITLLSFKTFLVLFAFSWQVQGQCPAVSYAYLANSADTTCIGADINFQCAIDDLASATWNFGDGSTGSSSYVDHSYSSNGIFAISVHMVSNCGSDTTLHDTVVIMDNAPFVGYPNIGGLSGSFCPGEEVDMYFNPWSNNQSTWVFGDGSATVTEQGTSSSHIYASAGKYQVMVTSSDVCGNDTTISDSIDIMNKTSYDPNAYAYPESDTICPGTNFTINTDYQTKNLEVSISDGSSYTGTYPSLNFSQTGTYTFIAKLFDACGNDTTITGSFVIGNVAGFKGNMNLYLPDSICPGEDITLYPGYNNASNTWDFGDGTVESSTENTVEHAYNSAGTFHIIYSATDFCGNSNTITDSIVVTNNLLVSGLEIQNLPDSVCPGQGVNLYASTDGGGSYVWDFGNGSTSDNKYTYVTYNSAGTYTVRLIGSNSCGSRDTVSANIKVSDAPRSMYDPNAYVQVDSDTICPGTNFTLYNSSEAVDMNVTMSDGSTYSGTNPQLNISQAGTYTYSATLTDACGTDTTITGSIIIGTNTEFTGYLDLYLPDSICPGDKIDVYTGSNIKTGSWDFGDGTSDSSSVSGKSIYHSYSAIGTYNIVYTGTDFCGNSKSVNDSVVVSNDVKVFIGGLEIPDSICPGDEFMVFADEDEYYDIAWDFGNGKTGDSFIEYVSYDTPGMYTVQLIASNKCGNSDTAVATIVVSNNVKGFHGELWDAELDAIVCLGDSVSLLAFPAYLNMYYDLGDGIGTNFPAKYDSITLGKDDILYKVSITNYKYTALGSYNVEMHFVSGCGVDHLIETGVIDVVANGDISADIEASYDVEEDDNVACTGVPVEFLLEGSGHYELDFGDGNSKSFDGGQIAIARHTYNTKGNYNVKLLTTNACGISDSASFEAIVDSCGNVVDGVNETSSKQNLTLYPNPSTGFVSIAGDFDNNAMVFVYGQTGDLIRSARLNASNLINLSDVANGTYIITVVQGDSVHSSLVYIIK